MSGLRQTAVTFTAGRTAVRGPSVRFSQHPRPPITDAVGAIGGSSSTPWTPRPCCRRPGHPGRPESSRGLTPGSNLMRACAVPSPRRKFISNLSQTFTFSPGRQRLLWGPRTGVPGEFAQETSGRARARSGARGPGHATAGDPELLLLFPPCGRASRPRRGITNSASRKSRGTKALRESSGVP